MKPHQWKFTGVHADVYRNVSNTYVNLRSGYLSADCINTIALDKAELVLLTPALSGFKRKSLYTDGRRPRAPSSPGMQDALLPKATACGRAEGNPPGEGGHGSR